MSVHSGLLGTASAGVVQELNPVQFLKQSLSLLQSMHW